MLRSTVITLAALLLGPTVATVLAQPPPYLAANIQQALDDRDSFLREATGYSGTDFAAVIARPQDVDALEQYYKRTRRAQSTWHCFYQGVLLRASLSAARPYLNCALRAAEAHAGQLWVLRLEAERYGLLSFADTLMQLFQRQVLIGGAELVTVTAQQVMHDAIRHAQAGENNAAEQNWALVRQLDPFSPWPALWSMRRGLAGQPQYIFSGIQDIYYQLRHSWQFQLAALHYTLKLLNLVLRVFVAGVFAVLFLKYLARAIHPYAERFPKAVPMFVRVLLVGSFILSLLAFGPIAFCWVLAFILWPSMQAKERLVAGICLVLIALSPIGATAESALRSWRSPSNTPMLYTRAMQEGYSPELYAHLTGHAQQHPRDALAHIACAVTAIKGDSLRAARRWAEAAASLRPSDPIVMTLLGATAQLGGNHKAALDVFERCYQSFPHYAPAYFNLGKALLHHMETLKGADLITQAAQLDRRGIESFVRRNDLFFKEHWPAKRQFILLDYPPDYFWKHYAGAYMASQRGIWADTASLWGISFLGLSPKLSLLIFIGLLLVLLMREHVVKAARKSRVKKVLICELCGAAMCKLCSKGPYCGSCYTTLSTISSEQRRQAMKVTLYEGARRREVWFASLLDVLFPGAGMLYETRTSHRTVLLVLPLTALLFAAAMIAVTRIYSYPLWVTERFFLPLYAVVGAYVAGFLLRGIVKSRKASVREED